MDRNKVLELAREIGAGEPESLYGRTDYVVMTKGDLERFAALIEREVRGDAEPVAWLYDFLNPDNRDEVIRNWITQDPAEIEHEKGFNVRPLYLRPAPAVVRQLVEAVEHLRQKAKWINDEQAIVGYEEMMEMKAALAAAKVEGL